ncbi:MAG: phage recombination protein Bet [Clostridia bacterium]|nr:phage recombination protein Bet [Clostridia bacterium]
MPNELMKVTYESAFGNVELDANTVKQYLVKGNGEVSDQEVMLFLKLCEAQKLNPFVTGEVYLIKFGSQPAQTVVGYDTYKRRADDNPNHMYFESGIVVCRGQAGEIVQKAGACLYPTEQLIGGWCRVHKLRNGHEVTTYKEVTFSEYNKGNAIWKEKPCTMIEKVAISQCLREAYPKDYEGMYTAEEISAGGYDIIDTDGTVIETTVPDDPVITQDDRKALFLTAYNAFGKEKGAEVIKTLMTEEGFESTTNMRRSEYDLIMKKLVEEIENSVPDEEPQE